MPKEAEKPSVPEAVVTEDLDVQSIINERRPSKLKPVSSTTSYPNTGYGQLYVKEEDCADAEADEEDEEDLNEDKRQYVSVGCGPSSVELRIFVDESEEQGEQREEETAADRRNSDSEVVVVVVDGTNGDGGIRRKKSPARDDRDSKA